MEDWTRLCARGEGGREGGSKKKSPFAKRRRRRRDKKDGEEEEEEKSDFARKYKGSPIVSWAGGWQGLKDIRQRVCPVR